MKYLFHPILYFMAFVRRGQVVALRSYKGETYLTVATCNPWGEMQANVHPIMCVGHVILHKDGTTTGESSYIKHWKKL